MCCGFIGAYFLEFGEISNTRNFIPINIFLFITIAPIYSAIVYWLIHKIYIK